MHKSYGVNELREMFLRFFECCSSTPAWPP